MHGARRRGEECQTGHPDRGHYCRCSFRGRSAICSSISAANYFLNSGYTMQSAAGSAAPIGDMMIMVGDAVFGQGHGRTFMLIEAITVFLALDRHDAVLHQHRRARHLRHGQGQRGAGTLRHAPREEPEPPPRHLDVGDHFMRSSASSRCPMAFGDAGAPTDAAIQALPHGILSSFGYTTHDKMAALPNSLLTVTLASNFGTFILYCLSCVICMVAYHNHPNFSMLRHFLIPIVRSPCEPGMHGVLPDWAIHGVWHGKGTAAGAWGSPPSGRSMEGSTSCAPARQRDAQRWSPAAAKAEGSRW